MDYNARFLVSYLNRWSQPDTIVPNPANPQNLNRYAYVLNSPLVLVDPSGHIPGCMDSFGCRPTSSAGGTSVSGTTEGSATEGIGNDLGDEWGEGQDDVTRLAAKLAGCNNNARCSANAVAYLTANFTAWEIRALLRLADAGPASFHAANYLFDNDTSFGNLTDQANTGAAYHCDSIDWKNIACGEWSISLSSQNFNGQMPEPTNIGALALIAHEAMHLEQGLGTSFSVYGELEGWQTQFKVTLELGGTLSTRRAQILDLPLSHSSEILNQALHLFYMDQGGYSEAKQEHVGLGYKAWVLPLNPFPWLSYYQP